MIDAVGLEEGTNRIREILQADGGDMEIASVDRDAGIVELKLVLEGATCRECVLPRPMLEQVGLDILRRSNSGVSLLRIEDPREA